MSRNHRIANPCFVQEANGNIDIVTDSVKQTRVTPDLIKSVILERIIDRIPNTTTCYRVMPVLRTQYDNVSHITLWNCKDKPTK